MTFIPVVLSGGSGTRLWPVSRTQFPKQFCEILDQSLLNKTLARLNPLGQPHILTTKTLSVLTEKSLKGFNIPSDNALYEPKGKNTAAAITYLCKRLTQENKSDAIVGIFPADHIIGKETEFHTVVQAAIKSAETGQIVTLGIQPTHPATGYGYIELANKATPNTAMQAVGFREKPDHNTAVEFLNSGKYLWNAGMFVFQVKTMTEALKTYWNDGYECFEKLNADLTNLAEIYDQVPSLSIDYAVMEHIKNHSCIPANIDWNDVGSWDEISKIMDSTSKPVQIDSKNNFYFGSGVQQANKKVAIIGADDLIIVDTGDALLISKKGQTQNVKDVIPELKDTTLAHEHTFEHRPWGSFEILRDTEHFKSKVIYVEPGQQLSYQSHAKRAEHWVIIQGHPEVVLNDKTLKLNPGESVYIPQGAKHRIRNTGQSSVQFVEVQVGTYFGEDDIVRYQDDYKRT